MPAQLTLDALVLAVSYAEFRERMHREACQTQANGRECPTCRAHHQDRRAADQELNAFLDSVAAEYGRV